VTHQMELNVRLEYRKSSRSHISVSNNIQRSILQWKRQFFHQMGLETLYIYIKPKNMQEAIKQCVYNASAWTRKKEVELCSSTIFCQCGKFLKAGIIFHIAYHFREDKSDAETATIVQSKSSVVLWEPSGSDNMSEPSLILAYFLIGQTSSIFFLFFGSLDPFVGDSSVLSFGIFSDSNTQTIPWLS